MKSIDIHRRPVRLRKLTLLVAAVVVLALGYGAGYGSDEIFLARGDDDTMCGQSPVVTTTSATLVDENTVDAGGAVTYDCHYNWQFYGLVWDTQPDPWLNRHAGITIIDAKPGGPFTSRMTGLTENTLYYFRAYADTLSGDGYGEVMTFHTGSRAGGGTWVWTEQDSPSRSLTGVASSSDGKKLVAVDGGTGPGRIYTSTDFGETWTHRWSEETYIGFGFVASSSDGTKLVAASTGASLLGGNEGLMYTSTDSGITWTEQTEIGKKNWQGVASSSDGTKLVAVDAGVKHGYIYISWDSGVDWPETGPLKNWNGVASSSDGTKLVAVDAGVSHGYIYTSTDSGHNWTEIDKGPLKNWKGVASSADGTKLVAVDAGQMHGYIYTSTDSGATWTETGPLKNWKAVASSADGTKLVAVEPGAPNIFSGSGYIHTSTDSGVTWTEDTEPKENWIAVASSSDGTKLVAVSRDGLIYTGRLEQ